MSLISLHVMGNLSSPFVVTDGNEIIGIDEFCSILGFNLTITSIHLKIKGSSLEDEIAWFKSHEDDYETLLLSSEDWEFVLDTLKYKRILDGR